MVVASFLLLSLIGLVRRQRWVIGILVAITTLMVIGQALAMAQLLKSGQGSLIEPYAYWLLCCEIAYLALAILVLVRSRVKNP